MHSMHKHLLLLGRAAGRDLRGEERGQVLQQARVQQLLFPLYNNHNPSDQGRGI